MPAIIQDPRGLSFSFWATTVTADNSLLPLAVDEKDWKAWARGIYQVTQNTPDPDQFEQWQDWAMAWVRST